MQMDLKPPSYHHPSHWDISDRGLLQALAEAPQKLHDEYKRLLEASGAFAWCPGESSKVRVLVPSAREMGIEIEATRYADSLDSLASEMLEVRRVAEHVNDLGNEVYTRLQKIEAQHSAVPANQAALVKAIEAAAVATKSDDQRSQS
jgi:hypothetical protein